MLKFWKAVFCICGKQKNTIGFHLIDWLVSRGSNLLLTISKQQSTKRTTRTNMKQFIISLLNFLDVSLGCKYNRLIGQDFTILSTLTSDKLFLEFGYFHLLFSLHSVSNSRLNIYSPILPGSNRLFPSFYIILYSISFLPTDYLYRVV